jgi:hypothetical protein
MKLILYFVILLASLGCTDRGMAESSRLKEGHVWCHLGSNWKEAPRETGLDEATAWATLVSFEPGGDFILLKCLLIRQGSAVRVSGGDPVVIYRGSWKAKEKVEVGFRQTFHTVEVEGEGVPQQKERATVNWREKSLVLQGKQFFLLDELEKGSFDSAVSQG